MGRDAAQGGGEAVRTVFGGRRRLVFGVGTAFPLNAMEMTGGVREGMPCAGSCGARGISSRPYFHLSKSDFFHE